jgi:type I restriction enzyme M protein
MIFTKTNSGGTDKVWFYDMHADGRSLDDKRTPISENDIPDIIARWKELTSTSSANRRPPELVEGSRSEQSFFVSKSDIAAQDYDLSLNRYKETIHEEVLYDPPQQILGELEGLEQDISRGLRELREMLDTPELVP